MNRQLVVSRERHRFIFVAPLWLLPFMVPVLFIGLVVGLFIWTAKASIALLAWAVRGIAEGQSRLREVMPERRHHGG